MSGVTLTSAMRNNLLSLRRLSSQMSKTQEILSTGKKVNSAIDNASNFYQARSLTNRAADLMELLNSMDQGIRTIETATVGLEQGAAFLEQATAVATEALTTAKIPAKEWFEARQDVAAVVSDWNELKAALDSGITGNIVIYGQIECEDSITLKDGQNLVGVGYFGIEDSEVNKRSGLSFTAATLADEVTINLGSDIMLSDLSLTFANRRNHCVKANGQKGIVLQNIHMNLSSISENGAFSRGFYGGEMELRGVNNFYGDGDSYVMDSVEFAMSGNSRLNTTTAIHNMSVSLYDNAQINIASQDKGLYGGEYNLYGNSKICVSAAKFNHTIQEAYVNMYGHSSIIAKGGYTFWGYELNLWSADCRVVLDADRYALRSTGNYDTFLNAVAGATIQTKEGTFQALQTITKAIIEDDATDIPPGYTKINDIAANATMEFGNVFDYVTAAEKEPAYKKEEDSLQQSSQNFKGILSEYDTMVADSSYQGVNLLTGGDVDVTFNETRSHRFTVSGRDMTSAGLGLITLDWQTQGDIARSLSEIAAALNSIRGFQEELGNHYGIIQTRQSFTEALADVLEIGADDLVLADMNEASAEYLTLQTRQQLAVNSLSLAAQSAQSVLSVF